MTVSVNGVAIDAGRWPNPEVAAVRELLRQRAAARFYLTDAVYGDKTETAIEHLLAEGVWVPTPTDAESLL